MQKTTLQQPSTFAKLHSITLPYTLSSGNVIFITSLSKLHIQQLHISYHAQVTTLKLETIKLSTDATYVEYPDVDDLYTFIMDISVTPIDKLISIRNGLVVLQEDKYQSEDFRSCEVCQERGFDKLRNCPMLGKHTYAKGVVYTFKNDNTLVLRECPMYEVNQSDVLEDALGLMRMLEHNILPTSGGLLEQTVFVNEVLPIVKPLIDKKNTPIM